MDAGLAEITSLTYSALRFMPKGMFPPIIIKFGATNLPIANLVLSSPTLSEKEVRDIAYFTVRPQLGTVQGISFPPTFGGAVRQITVFLDREKMQARGVSAAEIIKAVNAENLLVPAGNVKIGDFDYNVYSNSIVSLVKDMNDFPIKVANGVPVFLKDVGTRRRFHRGPGECGARKRASVRVCADLETGGRQYIGRDRRDPADAAETQRSAGRSRREAYLRSVQVHPTGHFHGAV